jgi:heme-degrading monooxygenase HmoA
MWAQLLQLQIKPGHEHHLPIVLAQLRSIEQTDSGLVRTTVMIDDEDQTRAFVLVVFDSEDAARDRESDPRRQEGLKAVRALMGEMLACPPQYVGMTVVEETFVG